MLRSSSSLPHPRFVTESKTFVDEILLKLWCELHLSTAARATVVASRRQFFVLGQGRATRARGGRGEERKGQEEEPTLFLEASDGARRVSEPDRVLSSILLSVQMTQS